MNENLAVDFTRCIACRACEVACERLHGCPTRIHVLTFPGAAVPISCRNCERPPCAIVCPQRALEWREDRGVVFWVDRCVQCGLCEPACPFGAITISVAPGSQFVSRCDLCASPVGNPGQPACVRTCPTGAIFRQADRPWVGKRRTMGHGLISVTRGRKSWS